MGNSRHDLELQASEYWPQQMIGHEDEVLMLHQSLKGFLGKVA
jgi:hypothetical protein